MSKEKNIINSLKSKPIIGTPIATDMMLPNHSGDHSKGMVLGTPVKNTDIINKSYADGLLNNPHITGDLSLNTGNLIYFGTGNDYMGCLIEGELTIEAQNSIGLISPTIYLNSFTGALSAVDGLVSGGTLSVPNGGTGVSSVVEGYILYGNGTDVLLCESNLFWDAGNDRLSLANGTYKNATLNLNKNNTDYTNTNGAGCHIFLSNPNASGQTCILAQVNNNNAFKIRTDSVYNLSWICYANTNDRGHYFYINGDYPSGTCRMKITNSGVIAGSSVVSSQPDASFEVETTSAVGIQAMTIDQNDADQAFIDYQGTSAANQSNNISTVNGDGDPSSPRLYNSTAGWQFTGMVKVEINGTAYWMPYYIADTS